MVIFLGLLLWFFINAWATIGVFFVTVSTFGEALFAGGFWAKVLGIILWVAVLTSWYHFGSGFSWSPE